jgi:O-antigen ligase
MARRIAISSIAVALRHRREKRCVPYHPVFYNPPLVYPALDPLWTIIFTALFVGSALLTLRRACLGAALMVFFTPFDATHAILGTTVVASKVVLLGVLTGLATRPQAWRVLRRQPAWGIVLAFAALIVANALSGLVASYPTEAIREVLKWTMYLLYFATLVVAYAADPAPRAIRVALFTSILIATVAALSEVFTGSIYGILLAGAAVPRIAGLMEGPNQFGGYLEVAIAALGAWQIRSPNWRTAALLGLTGIALPLTFSRAATICTVFIIMIFAITERRAALRLWPLALGFVTGFMNDLVWAKWSLSSILSRETDVDVATSGGLGDRRALWRAAIYFFAHHPWLGIGAGNYERELALAGLPGVRTQANNWYLQAAAEGGVVLLGATIGWIVTVVRACVVNIRRSTWALAACAASGALVLHGFFDDLIFYPKVAEPWIALIALGIASVL